MGAIGMATKAKLLQIVILDKYNSLRYRKKFATLKRLHIVGRAGFKISGTGKIYAHNLSIQALDYPVGIYVASGAKLTFGNVFINQGVGITCASQVTIEDETVIGEMTEIMDTDWHGIDGEAAKVEPISIGKHVWVGFRCIILKGVTIGDNSIIGGGSVVTHSVPPNTIFAGNPAQQIGTTKSGYTLST